ncbi:hypothetical protein XENOCAPTIV_023488 [Xenoophorus captivus]|uniref:Uncharacterized protein n=1 Tax=Xenoophorus captivus TaxID=1517983 RepID=A0ABV0RAJ4_9TELE
MTASLAVSKQMLHSKVARSRSLSPLLPPLLPPPGPSRSLLLSPAWNPPVLAGPPLLENRGSVAAMMLAAKRVKKKEHTEPEQLQRGPNRAGISEKSEVTAANANHEPWGAADISTLPASGLFPEGKLWGRG